MAPTIARVLMHKLRVMGGIRVTRFRLVQVAFVGVVAVAHAGCDRSANTPATATATAPAAPRRAHQREDGTVDDKGWRQDRDADFKARATSEIAEVYRGDKIHYTLPPGWVALRPKTADQPYLQAGLAAPDTDAAASTYVHVHRPIMDGTPKGMRPLNPIAALPQSVALGSVLLEAKGAGGAIDRKTTHEESSVLPAGLRMYEAMGEIVFPDGGVSYARCGVVEAEHELQSFCAHGPDVQRMTLAERQWLETVRPADGVVTVHAIRYGGDVSYAAPTSWKSKIVEGGSVMQLVPSVEHDPTLKEGEHTANAAIYLPTVWEGSAREYFARFADRFFKKHEKHEIVFDPGSSHDRVVTRMVWHKNEKPGGHQALCVSTVEHQLAQIACFFAESDAAMKEHGELGHRFIDSVAPVDGAIKDLAPCRPSRKLPEPIPSTEI